jgi:TolB-like protein/tetratricopeptide (TPR) repeat protein
MSNLFEELKRRNVFRVTIAYIAVAWLILQVADVVLGNISAPAWLFQALMFFLAIGFPVAILFAWAYELTPEGIKREREVDRSQSITQETGQKLNRMIIAVLFVAVGFLLVDKFMLRESTSETPATANTTMEKSVAVLPFVALSSGTDDEYFADGLTEEILNSLTRVPELLVTARTSAFHFKGKDIPIPDIAKQLGVAHVVEGSVRREGNRLRVTAQLIRAADGFHLWSENYDRETADTFSVQANIAERIADALGIVLDDERRALMQKSGLRSPEAFITYQKAFGLFQQAHGNPDIATALIPANDLLEQVIELAPDFFPAYLMSADRYSHILLNETAAQPLSSEDRNAVLGQINQHLDNAIRAAPDEASRLVATYDKLVINGDWKNIRAIFDRILALRSCNWPQWYDLPNLAFGNPEGTLELASTVTECNPMEFHGWAVSAWAHAWLGDFDAAAKVAQRGIDINHHDLIGSALITGHLGAKRFDDARLVADTALRTASRREETLLYIEIAEGNENTAAEVQAKVRADANLSTSSRILGFARTGAREEANRIAAATDARPMGHIALLITAHSCRCGAPWDLESTPNFAARLKEAGMPWPPGSPVEWPLKDW